jgi:Chlorophyll A-B binding protein
MIVSVCFRWSLVFLHISTILSFIVNPKIIPTRHPPFGANSPFKVLSLRATSDADKNTTQSTPPLPVSSYMTDDVGVMPPTGFWDPCGLSRDATEATLVQYRTAELKHGRVAMLCIIGYVVPEVYRFPGDIAPGLPFHSIPNGVAAIDAIPSLGWMQMIFLIGAVDYYGYFGSYAFGQGTTLSSEKLYQRQQSELAHGRLAMVASLELLRHDAQNYVLPNFDGLGEHLITGLPFLYT